MHASGRMQPLKCAWDKKSPDRRNPTPLTMSLAIHGQTEEQTADIRKGGVCIASRHQQNGRHQKGRSKVRFIVAVAFFSFENGCV